MEEPGGPQPPPRNIRLTQSPAQDPYAAPPAQSQARVSEGSQLPRTPAHLVQPRRLTKSRVFSGRPTRDNSRIEGTRPVRSGLPPPPSSRANLDREETRAGFLPSFRGFAGVGRTTRRPGGAERAALSLRVSSLDFRGERSARPARLGLHRTRQTRISISLSSSDSSRCSSCRLPPSQVRPSPAKSGYKRSTRCGSRIEGTRPVRFGLRPPPSSPANFDREETRASFAGPPPLWRGERDFRSG